MPKNITPKLTVLIVDDDPLLLDLYKTGFEAAGFLVVTAMNAKEGIKAAKDAKPDVVLSDIVMPDGDGFAFLEAAKGEAALKDIPVVVFTQLDNDEDRKEALALGARDYLVKNRLTPQEIVAKVRQFIK